MNEEKTKNNIIDEEVIGDEKKESEDIEPTMCDCGECTECIEEKGSCDCGDCDICAKNEEVDPPEETESEDLLSGVNPEDLP